MKKTKIDIPEGYVVGKIEVADGEVVVTYKEKEKNLPRTWEEFCRMFTVPFAFRPKCDPFDDRLITTQVNIPSVMADFTEDPEISDALIALIKLIHLRDCYNQGWRPDWKEGNMKFLIAFVDGEMRPNNWYTCAYSPLFFKSAEHRDMFLERFRNMIEKLKPLYGIMKGGEE